MPSFFKSAAIAAFAIFAGVQAQNSTIGPIAASNIGGWKYEGCFSVQSNTGLLLDSSLFMTDERCTARCGAYGFARVQGNNCYCSDDTAGLTKATEDLCRTRCGGNPNEACGGVPGSSKRQLVGGAVSLYSRLAIVPAGSIYVSVVANIYIDICPSCLGGLGPVTYCSVATLTGCGCPTPVTPTIPMSTTVTTIVCPTCPASVSTVTLTIPAGVTPGTATSSATVTAPATTVIACATCPGGYSTVTSSVCPGCSTATTASPTKPVFTGAAQNVKVGSGVLAGAMVVAALL